MRGLLAGLLAILCAAALAGAVRAEPAALPAAQEKPAERPAGPAGAAASNPGDPGAYPATQDNAVDPKQDKAVNAPAGSQSDRPAAGKLTGAMDSICLIMESAAEANALPLEFFARVIWQESRFQPNAIGPMTRRGYRAQGIAQFMPYTAEERGLLDPFNPVAALPKAAEFLSELRREFGNLGLAAAAYNAGPRRVRDYIGGRGGMPAETRHYVRAITGRSVDDWVAFREGDKDAIAKPTSCRQLAALLKEQPSFFIGELERRVREGSLRPWGVQLSAGFSKARVLAVYARVERQFRALLENLDPVILRTVLRTRGNSAFYQARVGVDTRAAADKLCAELTKKGGACMVLRNSRGTAEAFQRAENAE